MYFLRSANHRLVLMTLLTSLFFNQQIKAKLNTNIDEIEKTLETSLKAFTTNSAQAKAKIMRTNFQFDLKHQLYKSLEGKVRVMARLETGSNSSTVIDMYSPKNRIRLGDSYLKWDPMGFFYLKAGSLDQTRFTPLLIQQLPFTAVQEALYYQLDKNYQFFIQFQQAIPNNDVLTARLSGIEEGTPLYLTQTIGMKLDGDLLSLHTFGRHFQFKDISATIANQSRYIGNSISGSGNFNSSFLYQFDGYYLFADIGLTPADWEFRFWLHYLYNDKAPDNRNTGYFYGPLIRYSYFGAGFNLFENQSDSSPAFYASQSYPKNTEGQDYFLEGNFPEDKIKLRFHYIKTDLLTNSLYQASGTYWTFDFRKKYTF